MVLNMYISSKDLKSVAVQSICITSSSWFPLLLFVSSSMGFVPSGIIDVLMSFNSFVERLSSGWNLGLASMYPIIWRRSLSWRTRTQRSARSCINYTYLSIASQALIGCHVTGIWDSPPSVICLTSLADFVISLKLTLTFFSMLSVCASVVFIPASSPLNFECMPFSSHGAFELTFLMKVVNSSGVFARPLYLMMLCILS